MKRPQVGSPRAALIDSVEDGNGGSVVVARIADPSKLLDGQFLQLHGDVVELLVDLAVALLDGEEGSVESPSR